MADRQKYKQIIDAAVAEFQERGYSDASMDRVSARAEVSKRTVYKYFESKEKLFRVIVDTFTSRFAEMLDVRYQPGRPIREQLVELARAEGSILMSPDIMAMARMLISETLRSPDLAKKVEGIDKARPFVDMFRGASDEGQLAALDPETAAQEFLALLKARAFWPQIFGADLVTGADMERIVQASGIRMKDRPASLGRAGRIRLSRTAA
ncbi:MAG: TetR/AcrR family transcriptional regulator [Pseudomonadota bacterium]